LQLDKEELQTILTYDTSMYLNSVSPSAPTTSPSVAETAYQNKTALAHELKRSVKGEASRRIRSVYVTKPEAYDVMWQKLESFYEDVGASVQAALEDLHKMQNPQINLSDNS
jgi:hypothetical protein